MPRLGAAIWVIAAVSVPLSWIVGAVEVARHPGRVLPMLATALAAAVVARMLWVTGQTWAATYTRRARHVEAAHLIGRHDAALGAIIVDFPEPLAYCVPAPGGGVVVVSSGARALLTRRQLTAVLAHERAHLAGHHHLLIGAVTALSAVVPPLSLFRRLRPEVGRLLEMRADDVAARTHSRRTVAAAIAALASAATPTAALGAGGSTAFARAARLLDDRRAGGADRLWLGAAIVLVTIGPVFATMLPCPHPW
jgi:Zn-dependent protease with chaperone function